MSGSTISTTLTTGITLGASTGGTIFSSPLTIAGSGAVVVSTYQNSRNPALAVYSNQAHAELVNDGLVASSYSYIGGAGDSGGAELWYSGTVLNYGTIEGTAVEDDGVNLLVGGTLVNAATTALIYGNEFGVNLQAYGTTGLIVNDGTIAGAMAVLVKGGEITVENAGLIEAGSSGDALLDDYATLDLKLDAGASFVGDVVVERIDGTLPAAMIELDAGTGALDMGGSFSGFSTIVFDAGGTWSLGGTAAELADGQTISGFGAGDTLMLEGFTATSVSYANGELILSNGTATETITLAGTYSAQDFTMQDTSLGTEIVAVCHLRGTMIMTPGGERAIEALAVGDEVVTRFGGTRRIKWIGEQRHARQFLQTKRDLLPVHIEPGALGEGLPARRLSVSPGHSLLVDGVFLLARDLVNGITVTQGEAPDEVHYFNIEFDTHDCVLAEGSWSESYADCPGLRAQFHNEAEFRALYPEAPEAPDAPLLCAPRLLAGAAFEAALRPVLRRAEALAAPGELHGFIESDCGVLSGWAVDAANPGLMLRLEILLDGEVIAGCVAHALREDVRQAGHGDGRCGFSWPIPDGVRPARLAVRRAGGAQLLPRAHELAARAA